MNKKYKKNKYILELLLIIILAIAGCTHRNKIKKTDINKAKNKSNQKKDIIAQKKSINKEKHTITVWIHGTRLRHGFLQKKVFKSFFYRQKGFKKAKSYEKQYNLRKIADILCDKDTKRFDFDNFYFFGWSGKLNHQKRKDAAQQLHEALKSHIIAYKEKHGIIPKIRLITHSHGGNVALCLSDINKNTKEKINIDELLLLACPVQEKTAPMIKDPMFKKVYSLYSSIDLLQVIDPQGLTIKPKYVIKKPFFSKRIFAPHKNIVQTRLKINGRGILHIEFLLSKFIHILPDILEELDSWKSIEKRNKKVNLLKIRTTSHGITLRRKFTKG